MTTNYPLSLFVSSKMTELAAERRAVKKTLSRSDFAKYIIPWLWEDDAGARSEPIRSTYLTEVSSCDVYIGLFWLDYGQYTIDEFEQACQHHKPCLVYEKRLNVDQRCPELAAFLKKIEQVENPEGLTVRWFTTPEELAEKLQEDVMRLLISTLRKRYSHLGEPIVSRELFDELTQLAQNIRLSRQELVDIYRQSAPPDWPAPQDNDDTKLLALMLDRLAQARRRIDGTFPIIEFVARLSSCSIAHEQSVGDQLTGWVGKVVQNKGLDEAGIDMRSENLHPLEALERSPSLLVKVRPEPNKPDLVRIEACFLGEQKGYQKWVHVDEQPRKLETVAELLDQLTACCNTYIKNCEHTLTIEIFLTIPFFNYNTDQWMIDAGLNNMRPISNYYPLVIRSLDRIESGDTSGAQRMRYAWKQSWALFEQQVAALNPCFLSEEDCERATPEGLLNVACIAFTFMPQKVLDENSNIFSTMISAGVPVAIWPRYHDEQLGEREIRNVYNSFLPSCDFSTLPIVIWKKRKVDDGNHLLHRLVLLWDDPSRLPRKGKRRAAAPLKRGSA